ACPVDIPVSDRDRSRESGEGNKGRVLVGAVDVRARDIATVRGSAIGSGEVHPPGVDRDPRCPVLTVKRPLVSPAEIGVAERTRTKRPLRPVHVLVIDRYTRRVRRGSDEVLTNVRAVEFRATHSARDRVPPIHERGRRRGERECGEDGTQEKTYPHPVPVTRHRRGLLRFASTAGG